MCVHTAENVYSPYKLSDSEKHDAEKYLTDLSQQVVECLLKFKFLCCSSVNFLEKIATFCGSFRQLVIKNSLSKNTTKGLWMVKM